MSSYQFRFLKDCEPTKLVRVKINDGSEFAIVGAREGQFQPLAVLPRHKPPYLINLINNGRIDGDFETYQVLVYLEEYEVYVYHTERCEVAEGSLFQTPGTCVWSN